MNQLEEVDNMLAHKVDLIQRDEEAAKIIESVAKTEEIVKPAESAQVPDEDEFDIARDSA
jgi:hypothetical protein